MRERATRSGRARAMAQGARRSGGGARVVSVVEGGRLGILRGNGVR